MEIMYSDATDLAESIRTKRLSPVEVVDIHIKRMESTNPKINAIVTLCAEQARAAAKVAEAQVMKGEPLGPLHGVPFTAKDAFDSAGIPSQRGSLVFKGHVPNADATTIARFKAAGGILLAKTNLPEFAWWWETENLLTGRTNNPWNTSRTPGGSSGGEAAAIASGMSPIGIGSDIGGSLRSPASHNGIFSMKPTHGRVPMTGHWPAEPRQYWHGGPMARSVRDIALGLSILAGPDGSDSYARFPTSLDTSVPSGSRPLRIGWQAEPAFGPIEPDVKAAVANAAAGLAEAGHSVSAVRMPELENSNGIDLSGILFSAEAKPAFAKAVKGSDVPLTKQIQATLAAAAPTLPNYIGALQHMQLLSAAFERYFQDYDVFLCPVTVLPAPPPDLPSYTIEGVTVPSRVMVRATALFSLMGMPAMVVPYGLSTDHLPIGVQLIGKWYAEKTLLQAAAALEQSSGYRLLRTHYS